MSKKSNIILSLLFIILSFNFISSQNIITSWHYDKVQMYELESFGEILSGLDISTINIDDFTQDSITISKIKVTSLQHSLYDSYLNFKTGLLLFAPDKISLSFSFDYKVEDKLGNATFDLKINMLKVRIKNNKETKEQSVTIQGSIIADGISVFDISEKELRDKIKEVIYKEFQEKDYINQNIFNKINITEHYIKKYSQKPDFIFETSSFFDNKEIDIKINKFIYFCEDVEGKIEKALNYYSGEIGEYDDKTDRSSVPLKNEKFLNSVDTYNMFINKNLINLISKYIIEQGIKEKIYDKNTHKKQLPYDFTFSSLKIYFSGLEDKSDDLEFSTSITILELEPEKVKFNVKFIADKEEVFAMDVKLKLFLDFSLSNNVRLNLCLSKVDYLEAVITSGDVSISDEEGLITAIISSFDYENIPLCLSDDGISLRDYYSKINNVETADEGYYIEGDQLYQ